MSTRRLNLLVVSAATLLSGACVVFHGRLFPVNRHTWSQVTCTERRSEAPNLHVVFADRFDNALPGSTVTVMDGHYQHDAVTNGDGIADLTVRAGRLRVQVRLWGFHPATTEVELREGEGCTVALFTDADVTVSQTITALKM